MQTALTVAKWYERGAAFDASVHSRFAMLLPPAGRVRGFETPSFPQAD